MIIYIANATNMAFLVETKPYAVIDQIIYALNSFYMDEKKFRIIHKT